jgi:hypothetical protein
MRRRPTGFQDLIGFEICLRLAAEADLKTA